MGHRLNIDGKCIVCGEYTDYFCDACGDFICDRHQVKVPSGDPTKPTILCPSCAKKRKKRIYEIK